MALTNPAPVLYQNLLNYFKDKKQTKKTPSTGMMGFSASNGFKKKKPDSELSPAERAANYFKILKDKREEIKNGDNRRT